MVLIPLMTKQVPLEVVFSSLLGGAWGILVPHGSAFFASSRLDLSRVSHPKRRQIVAYIVKDCENSYRVVQDYGLPSIDKINGGEKGWRWRPEGRSSKRQIESVLPLEEIRSNKQNMSKNNSRYPWIHVNFTYWTRYAFRSKKYLHRNTIWERHSRVICLSCIEFRWGRRLNASLV